jgi:multidrug efflux pump subunit AcrB
MHLFDGASKSFLLSANLGSGGMKCISGLPSLQSSFCMSFFSTTSWLKLGRCHASGARGFNEANVAVQLVPSAERDLTTAESIEPFRQRLSTIAGLKISIGQASSMGSASKPLQLSILGDGEDQLRQISEQITTALAAIPGATEVESSIENTRRPLP